MAETSQRPHGTTCHAHPPCRRLTQFPVDTQWACCRLQDSTQTSPGDSATPATKTLTIYKYKDSSMAAGN